MPRRAQFDWTAIKADPVYQAYRLQRTRFVVLLLVLTGLVFFPLPLAAAFAPEWLVIPVNGAINVGIVLVLVQFVVAGLVAWVYARRADRVFDPAAEKVFFHALDHYKQR